jgi:hypothetical protein
VLSERYAFAPQTFANAAAGLRNMAWRTSLRRCSCEQCSAETSIQYFIFEAVKMILEQTSPFSAEEAATEIHREISTRKQFKKQSRASRKHWLALENAILAVENSSVHAGARPFMIASAFLEALKTARPVINPLLGALERTAACSATTQSASWRNSDELP